MESLRGVRVNVGPEGSGTRRLALRLLAAATLEGGVDYELAGLSYTQLMKLSEAELPEVVFSVSSLPSPIADHLIDKWSYRLAELPFARALGLQDPTVVAAEVPRGTYAFLPVVPVREVDTIGTRLLLVANQEVSREIGIKLLDTLYGGSQRDDPLLSSLTPQALEHRPEFPWHPAAVAFKKRGEPLLTAEDIEGVENLRSFLVSVAIALFFLWRWYQRRNSEGIERYMVNLQALENRAVVVPKEDQEQMDQLYEELRIIKDDVIGKIGDGVIPANELTNALFLQFSEVARALDRRMVR